MTHFYSAGPAPTNSVLLLTTEAEAKSFPTGDIDLGLCGRCGFVGNMSFDPALTEYSERYESTQGFSPTFNRFHDQLARDLIEKFNIRGKRIIEVGCGNGDFLILLCAHGNNRGVGYDPAFIAGREEIPEDVEVAFKTEFFTRDHVNEPADLFCCKMTLEHIKNTAEFVEVIAEAVRDKPNSLVFFQIPNAGQMFEELAFWEIYYEHASYFTKQSLEHLFRALGLDVVETWTGYENQYLMIAARPADDPAPPEPADASAFALVDRFKCGVASRLKEWRQRLDTWCDQDKTVILWGGSSRTVSFISTLGLGPEIAYVVDINPHKSGTYIAGSGHLIDTPDILERRPPDVVIVMNPIYCDEIGSDIAKMGLSPEIVAV
ncbi:MAG: class I SAM-dependent methyltransferase [Paracoccaceae bacterium]|nr:class I SAM-dependent methyltransferase [Paracoccaceae bacterium]